MTNNNSDQTITCPSCGAEFNIQPVSVVEEESEELGLLFKGSLNKFKCSSCKTELLYDSPIVYRDDPNRYVIQYYPCKTKENLVKTLARIDESFNQIFSDLSYVHVRDLLR